MEGGQGLGGMKNYEKRGLCTEHKDLKKVHAVGGIGTWAGRAQ